jgi:hypothetical protein
MPTAVEKLLKLTAASTANDILALLNEFATGPNTEVRDWVKANIESDKESLAVPLNVAVAALTGLVRGSKYFFTGDAGGREFSVNPFLHQLRKAIVSCPALEQKRKENAKLYHFYPEYLMANLAERVARIALAHAGMDPSNDEFFPLYSVGGYFSAEEVKRGLPGAGAVGTTCIMTARAVYHAAGCCMIGERPITVNTPNGPDVDLSRPSFKSRSYLSKKTNTWVNETYADPAVKRTVFDENNENNPPSLDLGDVYFIQGDGEAKFLLRPDRRDLAGHVGIIAAVEGARKFTTVDGGSGMGNRIDKNPGKQLKFFSDIGWSFGGTTSFTEAQLLQVKAELDKYQSDDAVEAWIAASGTPDQKQNLKVAKQNLDTAPNEQLKKIYAKNYRMVISNTRRLITLLAGNKIKGTVRTVQGWWKPSQYQELSVVGSELILRKLAS